jgi:hypothetical protein
MTAKETVSIDSFISSSLGGYINTYGNKMRHLSKTKKNTEAKSFNLTFRYIDGVLSINNPNFANTHHTVTL